MNALGSTIADRYILDSLLGEGAMGAVYAGRRLADGLPVAVKILLPEIAANEEMRKRFVREATALSTLQHPNIIGVLEFGEIASSCFLVMERLHGESLGTYTEEHPVTPETALVIADQMLAGLGFAHMHGVLHRDVKPDNLFVATQADGSRIIKLLDFGLVKFVDREAWNDQSTLTAQGTILGSPPYMPPEQIFGQTVDARADVYSAGVVLFELLTGIWPFMAEEVSEIFRAHALDPVPKLETARATLRVVPELDALIAKAMEKSPDQRFADARAMRTALQQLPRPAAWLIG